MSERIYKSVLILALTSCVLAVASTKVADWDDALKQLDLLVDVRHAIVQQYVEEPDQKKMIEGAVEGMVTSLEDPYTSYISPQEMQDFEKDVQGQFSGIGAEVDQVDGRVRIITPLEGSPAWNAGVLAGDLILEVDGEDTAGMALREAVSKLTGLEGTQVTIKVRHLSGEEQTLTITRARITTQTVKGLRRDAARQMDYLLDDGARIGYIRVSQFTDATMGNLVEAIEKLKAQGARGLLLDLRFNPGGLLTAAVGVSDMFLAPGERIVSVKGRVVPERVFSAEREPIVPASLPVAVLVNEASASASEIIAGALKDNGRAVVIGTRTFGKGSVQQVHMLDSDQGALKITNAYYYIPSGRHIHRKADAEVWGVDPDDGFYVAMTPEQQLSMLRARRNYDAHEPTAEEPEVTAEWLEQEMKDLQLAAALRAMRAKVETGEWLKVGEGDATVMERTREARELARQQDLLEARLGQIQTRLGKLRAGEVEEGDDAQPVTITIPSDFFAVTNEGVTLTAEGEQLIRSGVMGEHGALTIRFDGIEEKLGASAPAAP